MDTSPITREEMIEMFGEEMPIEAVNLVWNSDGEKTCGELRAELRAIAAARPTADLGDLVDELLVAVRELNEVPAAEKREVESLTGLSFGAIADYTQRAADRLILYREALERARSLFVYPYDDQEAIAEIDAVLSRSGH